MGYLMIRLKNLIVNLLPLDPEMTEQPGVDVPMMIPSLNKKLHPMLIEPTLILQIVKKRKVYKKDWIALF